MLLVMYVLYWLGLQSFTFLVPARPKDGSDGHRVLFLLQNAILSEHDMENRKNVIPGLMFWPTG